MTDTHKMPLITIIINCFNGEKFLRETMDSVINQTYSNWELIFWDNQSTDSTADIVNSYTDPRIRYIYAQRHTTLGEARSLAIKEMKGEYLCFLDSDDYWEENFLHSFVQVFSSNPSVGLVYSRFINLHTNIGKEILSHGGKESCIVSTEFVVRDYDIAMSSSMVNGKILKQLHGKFFNPQYSLIEDYDFYIRIASLSEVYYISDPLAVYRIHSSNNSYSDRWALEFMSLRNSIIAKEDGYEALGVFLNIISIRINYYKLISDSLRTNRISLVFKTLGNVILGRTSPKHLLLPILGTKNYFKFQTTVNNMHKR